MPKIEFEGKKYEVPEDTTPEELEQMFAAKAKMVPPVRVPAPTPELWSKMIESPEERRMRAKNSLEILKAEKKQASAEELPTYTKLLNRQAMVATASNPHRVAWAINPGSVYKK